MTYCLDMRKLKRLSSKNVFQRGEKAFIVEKNSRLNDKENIKNAYMSGIWHDFWEVQEQVRSVWLWGLKAMMNLLGKFLGFFFEISSSQLKLYERLTFTSCLVNVTKAEILIQLLTQKNEISLHAREAKKSHYRNQFEWQGKCEKITCMSAMRRSKSTNLHISKQKYDAKTWSRKNSNA